MILFQWIAILIIGGILLLEFIQIAQKRQVGWRAMLRLIVWTATALAIYYPDGVTQIARWVGVARGADAVTYIVALLFIATTFYFYSRYLRLQRQITDLSRYLAIREAKSPESATAPSQHAAQDNEPDSFATEG